jgi:DNA-binding YbaB/EbfC family protein
MLETRNGKLEHLKGPRIFRASSSETTSIVTSIDNGVPASSLIERRKKMAKGFGNMMKQMQKIQQEMERIQEELANKTVEGTAGGGMVKVVANGKQEILEVKIDPEVVNKDDVEMLEDLIVAAVNQAREKAAELQAEDMAKLTGGLKIPGLPF